MIRSGFGAAIVALASTALPIACSSSESAAPAPATADVGANEDATAGQNDSAATDASGETVAASEYCESIVDFFCDFYLRCDRIVAADVTECKSVFLESCNARYEPRYVDLEHAGLLTLSRSGIAACAAHLAAVSCQEQASDLDGPCNGMWKGTLPAGGKCGFDVESFVCAPGATCTLGLDLCGKCDAVAPRGGACEPGGTRCGTDDACVDGACVARALPGNNCDDKTPCRVGATCTSAECVATATVGEGAACDSKHRCAYRSYCTGGKCVRASLLGEPCTTSSGCASGRCDGNKCVALLESGKACAANSDCRSAVCANSVCRSLPSGCIAP